MFEILSSVALNRESEQGEIAVAVSDVHDREAERIRTSFATSEDHRRAARYRSSNRRIQSLTARCALRFLIETVTQIPGKAWRFDASSRRAQSCLPHGLAERPFVSVSHSQSLIACAVSIDRAVGIDVEHCRPDRDVEALAAFAFADDEIDAVCAGGANAFYRIWTMREAIAKAAGVDLATLHKRPLRGTNVNPVVTRVRLDDREFLVEQRVCATNYALGIAVALPPASQGMGYDPHAELTLKPIRSNQSRPRSRAFASDHPAASAWAIDASS